MDSAVGKDIYFYCDTVFSRTVCEPMQGEPQAALLSPPQPMSTHEATSSSRRSGWKIFVLMRSVSYELVCTPRCPKTYWDVGNRSVGVLNRCVRAGLFIISSLPRQADQPDA
ncbi:hypothetical protein Pcinc_026018 [Petrolisthes cinctipes]|uniref:Uncharacterized protein n=1 Tax=Petrolisthes cinctipes TaxID=88211 RepID=A0AAE1F7P8_PETCI|nr:hypothetical protein Pcinc_026018 [Petrolisthes cinctipes]